MISVGSRDESKRIDLGLGMEETELEEGEAPSYHEGNEDSTIDPDIALSYFEEKIQNVLGHFQKAFEGGASAENLGSKFDGYGSFLPTYQRSPSWSHAKSPAEVPNYDSPRSHRKLHSEDKKHNLIASSSTSPSTRSRTTSGKSVSVGSSLKCIGYSQSTHADESSLKSGTNKKSVNDQRTLNVRIKVGSESLSTQKNADIYSGLGLVVSPSSSLDDSPTTSEGQCVLDVPETSPTSILQIMTSYTGELLLSPLSEDLIHLPEKKKLRGKCETKPVDNMSKSSVISHNGSLSNRSNRKFLEKKGTMSSEKDEDFSTSLMYQKNNSDTDNSASLLKKEKETDVDILGYEGLVSNAMKLPLLSSSHPIVADPIKDMSTATIVPKDGVKGETFPPFIEKKHLDSGLAQDIGKVEKLVGRMDSSGKASESMERNLFGCAAAGPQEDVRVPKGETPQGLNQSELNVSKGIKALNAAESTDPLKPLVVQKGGEEGLESAIKKSSTGGKSKQMVEPSKSVKTHNNCLILKNDSLDLQKDYEKPGDRYKDFFGEEFGDHDNESISGEMTSSGRLENPQLVGKRSSSKDHNMSKEKHNSRNSEKQLQQENYPRPTSQLAPPPGNGQSSEAPPGMIPLVKEDWVECDKCKQWRLLPPGTNPKSLPDKWLCRMLNWLPGKNRCNIPEEETTNALRALYQPFTSVPAPASEIQDLRPSNSVGISVGMTTGDDRCPTQEHQLFAVSTATISGKKKHGSVKAANSADLDGLTQSSDSLKKSLGSSGKRHELSSRNNSPSAEVSAYRHIQQSSMASEKINDAQTEKISFASSSGKGTNTKIKSKLESDVELSRASKRIKNEELHFADEYWVSDNGGASSKAGQRRSSSLSNNNASGNDQDKYYNPKDLNGEAKKSAVSVMNAETYVPSGEGLLFSGKCGDEDSRKRKTKERHGSQIHRESLSNPGQNHLQSVDFIEELSDNDLQKEKNSRLSKSGGKARSGNKASLGTDRKIRITKDQCDGQYIDESKAADYLKSNIGSAHTSVAANSSSSKVSGSHKSRTIGQEAKGSPVESVSSSPLRFPNADKVTLTSKTLNGQDDFHDSGSLTAVSPRRLSRVEDGGNNRTGSVEKDATFSVIDHDIDVYSDQLYQSNPYSSNKRTSGQCKVEVKTNNVLSQNSESHSKKSGKVPSHSKDKASASGSDSDKVNIKASDSRNDSMERVHLHEEKSKSRRNKTDEKCGTPSKGEKFASKNYSAGGISNESSKAPSQKKLGQDAIRSQDKKHNLQEENDNEKFPKKSKQAELHGNGKSHSLPPLARTQTETVAQPVSGSQKENAVKSLAADAFDNGDAPKAPNQRKKYENLNGQPVRHPTPNSHKVWDVEAPSPLRRDPSSHAANNALKEAKDLKHMADRLKNNGSNESIGLYFQAALKFLHGASLLESGSSEATKHNELMHSMNIYSSTAKLCEFCAREYEKSKDMAAAALAYKCMEVAYMRVVYSSNGNASRDRNELRNALQIGPTGESPSSSASDVDNLNHQATADKAASAKVIGSPQVSGSHAITSRDRASLLRVLNFAQDVNFAMEASRKSRSAFAAATSRVGETSDNKVIHSLKKALNFNFQDVEGLLWLVKNAMDAISR